MVQALNSAGYDVTYHALDAALASEYPPPKLSTSYATKFEVVLLDGRIDGHQELVDLLRQTHEVLVPDGFVVAMFPGTSEEGAIAQVREIFSEAGYGFVRLEYIANALAISHGLRRELPLTILVKARRPNVTLPLITSKIRLRGSARPDSEPAFNPPPPDSLGRNPRELRLQLALAIARAAAVKSEEARLRAEAEWFSLYEDLEETRAEAKAMCLRLLDAVDAAKEEGCALLREMDTAAADLESAVAREALRRTEALASKLADALEETDLLRTELEAVRAASIADKATMQAYADFARERAEADIRTHVIENSERERQARERLEQELQSTQQRLVALQEQFDQDNNALRVRVEEAEHALASQTDQLIENLRNEGTRLSTLIDTVQTSRFWRFKRWLNRLRGGSFS